MGFLLVLFPEDHHHHHHHHPYNKPKIGNTDDSPPPLPFSSGLTGRKRRRSSSWSCWSWPRNVAQSTIIVASFAMLLILTLLLLLFFTHSNLQLPSPSSSPSLYPQPPRRRYLSQASSGAANFRRPTATATSNRQEQKIVYDENEQKHALQGVGTLIVRGTAAMADLVVAHAGQDDSPERVRLFMRLFHRSGLANKADLAFIFADAQSASMLGGAIRRESHSFLQLIHRLDNEQLSFDAAKFTTKAGQRAEPIWGRTRPIRTRIGSGYESNSTSNSSKLVYGSVVGFETSDLDPEDTLSGFITKPPMSLRRWACYPLLLGRVRRSYKHIVLVELSSILVTGDPLPRIRGKSSETVLVAPTRKTRSINPEVILGGSRGIRRLANAMLTEIVRMAMTKSAAHHSEANVLTQLVRNEFLLKDQVKDELLPEPVAEMKTVAASLKTAETRGDHSWSVLSKYGVVRASDQHVSAIDRFVTNKICSSSQLEASVYSECNINS